MLTTEAEAETKWCSPGQVVTDGTDIFSSQDPTTGLSARLLCIASDCMSWRWADSAQTKGYCGRAGTVEFPTRFK